MQAILSTKRGQCALQSFNSYQKSLIEVIFKLWHQNISFLSIHVKICKFDF